MRRLIVAAACFLMMACEPPPPTELQAKGGEQIYTKLCSTCHAPDGRSLATIAPPLAGHAVRLLAAGSRPHMIQIVLNGMSGPIEVGGRRYDGIMAPLRYLKDEQVADILNYVLTSWGNGGLLSADFRPFTAVEVQKERMPVLSPREVAARRPQMASAPPR